MVNRAVVGEFVRYAISGVVLAALYSAVYLTLATQFGIAVLVANTAAFVVNLLAGWLIHSRWSFVNRGHALPAPVAHARFVVINLAGYALNSLWVWLVVDLLHGSPAVSLIPVLLVTPILAFTLNRVWIFGSGL